MSVTEDQFLRPERYTREGLGEVIPRPIPVAASIQLSVLREGLKILQHPETDIPYELARLRGMEIREIRTAHPFVTKESDIYNKAYRLVSERDEKKELVELVNWLLYLIKLSNNGEDSSGSGTE